jgi:hypothetical protein
MALVGTTRQARAKLASGSNGVSDPRAPALGLPRNAGLALALVVSALSAAGCLPADVAGTGQANPAGGSAGSPASGGAGGDNTATAGSGGVISGGGGAGGAAAGAGGAAAGSGGSPQAGTAGATGGGGSSAGGSAGSGTGGGGSNLVTNGDFSNGETLWHVEPHSGTETHGVMNGAYCITLTQTASVTMGWLTASDLASAFPIVDGASYTFSYQASVTGSPVTFVAVIGPAPTTSGNFAGFTSPNESLTGTLQTLSHTFQAAGAQASSGLAFNITASAAAQSVVCVDNVSVVKN